MSENVKNSTRADVWQIIEEKTGEALSLDEKKRTFRSGCIIITLGFIKNRFSCKEKTSIRHDKSMSVSQSVIQLQKSSFDSFQTWAVKKVKKLPSLQKQETFVPIQAFHVKAVKKVWWWQKAHYWKSRGIVQNLVSIPFSPTQIFAKQDLKSLSWWQHSPKKKTWFSDFS